MINYEMAGQVIRNSPPACWVAKTNVRFLPYGINMKRWKLREEDQCPRCHKPAKSKDHITQCQAPEAIKQWTKAVQSLDYWRQNQTQTWLYIKISSKD